MKINFRTPWSSTVIALCLIFAYINIGAMPQNGKEEPSESEKIYVAKEIDEKAIIDRQSWLDSFPSGRECGNGQWEVHLRVVLRKTGKVTDVVVRKKSGCDALDRKTIKAAQKVKFTPARKDGNDVSTYHMFQYTANVSGR